MRRDKDGAEERKGTTADLGESEGGVVEDFPVRLSELKTRTDRSRASTGVSASSLVRRLPPTSFSTAIARVSSLTPAM